MNREPTKQPKDFWDYVPKPTLWSRIKDVLGTLKMIVKGGPKC